MKFFLRIQVIRDHVEKRLWLCQDNYISKIVSTFNLQDSKCPTVPLVTNDLRLYEAQATPQDIHGYQSRVGSINYAAVVTRPDMSRTAQKLAEFLVNPGPLHRQAADHAIAYLNGTKYLACAYRPDSGQPSFACSSDTSFADDTQSRQSTEGYHFLLFRGTIDWRCTKQDTVKTSTTEAELYSLSHAAAQLYWWQRFFSQIKLDLGQEFKLFCDNL